MDLSTSIWTSSPTENPSSFSCSVPTRNIDSLREGGYNLHRFYWPILEGWRKNALYIILVFLMIVVLINIGLTVWIIYALKLNFHGIGTLTIVKGGVRLNGKAYVRDQLIASSITSRQGVPMRLESYKNFTITASSKMSHVESYLRISKDKLECRTNKFQIRDTRNKSLFQVTPEQVFVNSDSLKLGGDGGISVEGSVQVPELKAPAGHDLVLESPTRSLEIRAPESIIIETRSGSIRAQTPGDIELQSMVGAIQLEAANVYMKNLTLAKKGNVSLRSKTTNVYQLCVCADGKLFLANSKASCVSYETDDVCQFQ